MWPTMWNILRRTEYRRIRSEEALAEETFQEDCCIWNGRDRHRSRQAFRVDAARGRKSGRQYRRPRVTQGSLVRYLISTRDTDIVGLSTRDGSVSG